MPPSVRMYHAALFYFIDRPACLPLALFFGYKLRLTCDVILQLRISLHVLNLFPSTYNSTSYLYEKVWN